MADIVFSFAASHSPMVVTEGEQWAERALDDFRNQRLNLSDGRYLSYDELAKENGAPYGAVATKEKFLDVSASAQRALDHIADRLEQAVPDVVLIVGDDQGDLFSVSNMPAVSIFYGDEILTQQASLGEEKPEWYRQAVKGYAMDYVHSFPGHPKLALELIEGLIESDVDVGAAAKVDDPQNAGIGHAFGFVIERLFRGRSIPVVPILLNTYFQPNAPTSRRCYSIGQTLARLIKENNSSLRIAVAASGGLSHFVVDETLDRKILAAIKSKDRDVFTNLTRGELNSGSSEILNWVMVAAMSEGLDNDWSDYYPGYRTPAGTGTGLGFATWSAAKI